MGLFSKKTLADGVQEKSRRRDRLLRHIATPTEDSDDAAVMKTTKPVVDENLLSSERRDDGVFRIVATADTEREASVEPLSTVEPTKEVVPPQVDILARALYQLSEPDRDAIRPYTSIKDSNIIGVLDGSLAAVNSQKRACDNKRWTLTFGGQTIIVKEKVEKITVWIDRFKDVGDLVAGLDPVHAGLPWAGVKLLLEASVAEANQMAALLVGCETALYMANRLKVYMNFLSSIPQGQSQSNLEDSLIKMYACVLEFLAQAFQIYQQSTWKRTFLAFWNPSDVAEFEKTCHMLGREVEVEASNADRTMSEHDRGVLVDVNTKMENALKELEQLHTVQTSLDRIERKMDLARLRTVQGALFDSHDQVHRACYAATRQDVLSKIRAWTQDPDGKRIFWLSGMAGTGKSTISVSVCEWLKQQGPNGTVDLGGSFFFKRGEGDRGSAALLMPTIVGELVQKIPGLDASVAQALDTDICSKAVSEQFNKLIFEPLKDLAPNTQCPILVVVIDALDECAEDKDIKTMLTLWDSLSQVHTISLRLFVTSRPERSIRSAFRRIAANRQPDIELHEVPHQIVLKDIFTYLKDSLAQFRDDFNLDPPTGVPLPENWPAQSELSDIVNIAVPLFIVAATIYRFLTKENTNPKKELTAILSKPRGAKMAQIYMPVLERFANAATDPIDRDEICYDFRNIVGTIICLEEPLSRAALADLLGMDDELVTLRLNNLPSVLHIPKVADKPVRPLHLSFGEFLKSETCNDEAFRVDVRGTHFMLWQRCLRLLSGTDGLREDICNLKHPGHLRREVSPILVNQHLRPAIQYACRYWVYHFKSSVSALSDEDEVHVFLQHHFLHWLEALSLMDRLADAIELINILQSQKTLENSGHIVACLEDARRFLLANRFVAELAPLQLYSSALVFAPQNCIIRRQCGPLPAWIQQHPITPLTWSLELQRLEGHTGGIQAVAFSPDGSLLASASSSGIVLLWQVSTGQEVQKLEGSYINDSCIRAVAFSPDGSLLALALDLTVQLWQVSTGQEVQKLEGHTSDVHAVAFSPDGLLLASASADQTIRLWQVSTGQEVQKLEGHNSCVRAVAFSPDGLLLASASMSASDIPPWDQKLQLWQVSTGQETQKLEGDGLGSAVAFSPNGSLLASASLDGRVQLWQMSTGQEVHKLEGHDGWVLAVDFSPDGSLLASASADRTVRLWQVSTGQQIQKLKGHASSVYAVAFLRDGSLLASGSEDGTVRLWQVSTDQEIQKLEGHDNWVLAVAFSPDGSLLASVSENGTLRLWQVSTGQEVQKFKGYDSWVYEVAFSPNSLLLASGLWNGTVRLRQVSTGQEVQRLEGHTSWVCVVAFSPDSSLLASAEAEADRTIRLWQVSTGQEVQKLEGHNSFVRAVAFSPDGLLLASASDDLIVRIWQVSTGQEVQKLEGHTGTVVAVAFSPDGSLLASAGDYTVRLWQVSTGQAVQIFKPTNSVSKLAFSSDNTKLITDRGYLYTGLPAFTTSYSQPTDSGYLLNDDWIEHHGQKLLWLPQEYRTGTSAIYNNTIGVGQSNGYISFLKLNYL